MLCQTAPTHASRQGACCQHAVSVQSLPCFSGYLLVRVVVLVRIVSKPDAESGHQGPQLYSQTRVKGGRDHLSTSESWLGYGQETCSQSLARKVRGEFV